MPPRALIPRWSSDASPEANVRFNRAVVATAAAEPQVRHLASLWSDDVLPHDPAGALRAMARIADEHWDFRAGQERNQAAVPDLDRPTQQAIRRAALPLGLIRPPSPHRRRYDTAFVLGGLLRGCLTRWREMQHLHAKGIAFGEIVGLGGSRELTPLEVDQAIQLGLSCTTEFEAMVAGLHRAFGDRTPVTSQQHEDAIESASWRIDQFEPNLCVAAAPSTQPEVRRANTEDAISWWLDRAQGLSVSSNLMVTNAIYGPYQAAVAVRTLGVRRGIDVEMAGISQASADLGALTVRFEPHHYLQEIGSTLRGYLALYECLEDPTQRPG